jgi:hypothetical protein
VVGLPVVYVLLGFLAVGRGNDFKWVAESMYSSKSECLQSLAKVQNEERDSSPNEPPSKFPERKCVEYRPN